MGYQIRAREGDVAFLERLRSSPSEVLGRPYAGYLLFLATGADREVVSWLHANIVNLDSLSGHHIAFGIFVREPRVGLDLIGHNGRPVPKHTASPPKSVGKVYHVAVSKAERLVDGLYLRDVDTDDYLTAVTYGTDDAARHFGVLNQLPCLLVLDAVTGKSVHLLRLDRGVMNSFIKMMREVLHHLDNDPRVQAHLAAMLAVQRATEHTDQLRLELANADSALRKQVDKSRFMRQDGAVADLVGALESVASATGGREYVRAAKVLEKAIQAGNRLGLKLEDLASLQPASLTLHSLERFTFQDHWPLNPTNERSLQAIVEHARAILEGEHVEFPRSTTECRTVSDRVVQRHQRLLAVVRRRLPDAKTMAAANAEAWATSERELEVNVGRVKTALAAAQQEKLRVEEVLRSTEAPSFSKLVMEAARKEKVGVVVHAIADHARAFAGAALTPEFMMKLAGGG